MSQSDCLFCNMASGGQEVEKLHDDALCFAIRDINTRAPTHPLLVARERHPALPAILDKVKILASEEFEKLFPEY